jgi:hypothetical protein
VFFSIDDGDHWSQLRLNLPVTPIHDLVIKGNDLVVATHGRSFWVLDDISPLRELTSTFGDEPAHLFKPAKTSRVRRSVNNDTPLPPEEPQGENPPAGAIIYYFLGGGTSGEVTLEILDHSGQVIRGYSSNDQPHTPRTPPPFPDYWLPKQEILSAEAGMHRFTWDLRYAPPGAAGGGYAMAVANKQTEPAAQGPLVVPGAYHVRLTVAGRSYEQPLEVGPDPRVKTTQQEFAQQFDLAKRVYDRLQQAALAIQEVEQRRTQLKQQPNPDLDRKLVSIAGAARGEEDEEAPRPGAVTLRQVSASLSHLLGVVESADTPPTKQASDAAQDAFTQLEGLLGQLKQLGAQ